MSAISWDPTHRVRNLVRILKSTGRPMPRWYDVHIGYDAAQASYSLRNTDAVLDASQVQQPLVIGEVAYDSREIARAIHRFQQRGSRTVEEVSPWYVRTAKGCQVTPPYTPGVYQRALRAG